ncbi:MAG: hypothetical protein IKR18_06800 [Bacteroidaceae bacterium]|nr:hypothetical protein [Bacteroidaceae bacterium]
MGPNAPNLLFFVPVAPLAVANSGGRFSPVLSRFFTLPDRGQNFHGLKIIFVPMKIDFHRHKRRSQGAEKPFSTGSAENRSIRGVQRGPKSAFGKIRPNSIFQVCKEILPSGIIVSDGVSDFSHRAQRQEKAGTEVLTFYISVRPLPLYFTITFRPLIT